MDGEYRSFEVLLGETLEDITVSENKDEILFKTTSGKEYLMYHDQCCCEDVTVEDIDGDIDDLTGNPILLAEEVIWDGENPDGINPPEYAKFAVEWLNRRGSISINPVTSKEDRKAVKWLRKHSLIKVIGTKPLEYEPV